MDWKYYKQMKKVFNIETHCRDECVKFIVKRYPVMMEQLKNRFDALPLDLTLQATFKHIFSNVTDVVDTREEYVKTHAVLLSISFQASEEDGLFIYLKQVTKLLRRLEVLNDGKEYDSELIVAQCQSMIRNLGIRKRELRKIDKDWTKEDKYKPDETRLERFKKYYIAETAILDADEVQSTNYQANSVIEHKIDNLTTNILKLQNKNSVLMANQEEMASIYKNGGVPAEITINGSGASTAKGPELAAYISQLLEECTQGNNSSSKGFSGGNTNQNVDPRKQQVEITDNLSTTVNLVESTCTMDSKSAPNGSG